MLKSDVNREKEARDRQFVDLGNFLAPPGARTLINAPSALKGYCAFGAKGLLDK